MRKYNLDYIKSFYGKNSSEYSFATKLFEAEKKISLATTFSMKKNCTGENIVIVFKQNMKTKTITEQTKNHYDLFGVLKKSSAEKLDVDVEHFIDNILYKLVKNGYCFFESI